MHYEAKTSPCLNTCAHPLAKQSCTAFPQGGCTCNDNLLFNGTTCIPASRCGCISPDGTYYAVGKCMETPLPIDDAQKWFQVNTSIVTFDCTKHCSCEVNKDQVINHCVPLPACAANAICTMLKNGFRGCKCNGNYIGDGCTWYYEPFSKTTKHHSVVLF